jgi:hypothetical protein
MDCCYRSDGCGGQPAHPPLGRKGGIIAEYEILGPYALAILMGLGSTCIFIWGVMGGALSETDQAALNFYHAEMANDRFKDHADRP